MNKRKYSVGIIIIILVGVFLANKSESIEDRYYNEIFDSAQILYSEVSAILMYETQEEIDSVREEVNKVSDSVNLLETNPDTNEGEIIILDMLELANKAIELQEERINGSDTYEIEESFDTIDSLETGLLEIGHLIDVKEINIR